MIRQINFVFLVLIATVVGAVAHASTTPSTSIATRTGEIAPPAVERTGRVTDAANLLTPVQRLALTLKLDELERTTRHEMVIVTVRTLGGRDVAPFTRDLGSSWGVGGKRNDGIVLLVAPEEQMVWIAVGHGLEGKLSKEACQKIMDDTMMPRFRAGQLDDGIDAGTDALMAALH
jgi:uncharacterized protein